MPIIPINDHLLVERCDRPTKSAGGVHLPEDASTREADEGIVLDGGPSHNSLEGRRVVFRAYGGSEVEVDGKKLILLPYRNIFGVYETE